MKQTWRALPRDERSDAVAAAFVVPSVHVLLRVVGYHRLRQWAERSAGRAPLQRPRPDDPAPLVRRARLAITRVRVYSPLPGNCLSRSLALWWRLRRHGLEPDLRFGASLDRGALSAHAWVEWQGQVLNDEPDVADRYPPLAPSSR